MESKKNQSIHACTPHWTLDVHPKVHIHVISKSHHIGKNYNL